MASSAQLCGQFLFKCISVHPDPLYVAHIFAHTMHSCPEIARPKLVSSIESGLHHLLLHDPSRVRALEIEPEKQNAEEQARKQKAEKKERRRRKRAAREASARPKRVRSSSRKTSNAVEPQTPLPAKTSVAAEIQVTAKPVPTPPSPAGKARAAAASSSKPRKGVNPSNRRRATLRSEKSLIEDETSPLTSMDMTNILSMKTFMRNFTDSERDELLKFLPDCDRRNLSAISDVFRYNSHFQQAVHQFQEGLLTGQEDADYLRYKPRQRRSRDRWKEHFFEDYWGQRIGRPNDEQEAYDQEKVFSFAERRAEMTAAGIEEPMVELSDSEPEDLAPSSSSLAPPPGRSCPTSPLVPLVKSQSTRTNPYILLAPLKDLAASPAEGYALHCRRRTSSQDHLAALNGKLGEQIAAWTTKRYVPVVPFPLPGGSTTAAQRAAASTSMKKRKRESAHRPSNVVAAITILKEGGGSMTTAEITQTAIARNWVNPDARTPSNTFSSVLHSLIRKPINERCVRKLGPGLWEYFEPASSSTEET